MSVSSEAVRGEKVLRGLVLNGPDRRELRLILSGAFNREELEIALSEDSPSRVYEEFVRPSDFSHELFQLIAKAERQGWLDDLVELIPEQWIPSGPWPGEDADPATTLPGVAAAGYRRELAGDRVCGPQ